MKSHKWDVRSGLVCVCHVCLGQQLKLYPKTRSMKNREDLEKKSQAPEYSSSGTPVVI
jgi:hypothetical protein